MLKPEKLDPKAEFSVSVERNRGLVEHIERLHGHYEVEHRNAKGELLHKFSFDNLVTNVGRNSLLGVYFHADTQLPTWYLGLVDAAGFTAFAAADIASSHTGWTEFAHYSGGVRQTWTPAAPASQSISNTSVVTFTITAPGGTVHGGFLISDSTLSGSTGILWSEAAFPADIPVAATDTIRVTLTITD